MSGIDLNRAGTPLLEIVSEPDMRSAKEAVAYSKALHTLVRWIGICDGNMQEGSFRCDANVSVRKPGEPLGTRREIKNLNSFKFMQQAIDYEVRWQIEELEEGRSIQQATVLFNSDTGETRAMRTKEDAADYRYFPDPDLPPLMIASEWIEQIRAGMRILPRELAARYANEYGLTPYLASQVTSSYAKAMLFESASIGNSDTAAIPASRLNDKAFLSAFVRRIAIWIAGEVSRKTNESDGPEWQFWISGNTLGRIALYEHDGVISTKAAKLLFEKIWDEARLNQNCRPPSEIDAIIEELGLRQMNDSSELEKIVDEVLAANPKNIAEYKAGNAKALNALVGQIMKGSKGKANPQQVNELLRKKLG